jgi:nucleoside 2-deoxyribosyltransferase
VSNLVYLAGPMTGLTVGKINHWRDDFARTLEGTGLRCLSPMRGINYLPSDEPLLQTYDDHPLSRQEGIVTRDYLDIARSDAIVANFLGSERVSIGTVWEIGVAYALKKPVVMVIEDGNIHDHCMLRESARYGYRTDSLDEAAALLQSLLLPDVIKPDPDWGIYATHSNST